ncbi:MAG: hypothetical protein V1783_01170 [Bacteroidota bacterium]|jgi:hypothetical protein
MGTSEYINNQQGELEINRYYPFLLLKTTAMPDGLEYYVIEDPFGRKHLMEKKPYENYGFEVGQSVEIRIDKVNCKGKVFFEPKHPHYSLGASIKVPFVGHSTETDKFNETIPVLLVKDPYDNITSVKPMSDAQRNPGYTTDFLTCEVHKISKGRLILKQIG